PRILRSTPWARLRFRSGSLGASARTRGPVKGPRGRAGRQPGGRSRPGISAAAQLVVSDSRSRTMIASPPRARARPAQKRRPVTLEPVLASGWALTAPRWKLSPRTLVRTVVGTPGTAVVVVD